jgi:2'-5' RNA ligase
MFLSSNRLTPIRGYRWGLPMRLFVALPLPENVRWQLRLLCGGLPGARWVPQENYHITLRFLGDVDGRDTDYVDAALAGIRAPAFKLRLSGVGHFSNGNRVKAVWAGVEKEPALQHLHDKVESAVVRAGLPPLGHKFTPHVTLTWPKDPPVAKLQHYLAGHNLFRSEPFEVTHFILFSSLTGGESSVYHAERSYALTARPPVSASSASAGADSGAVAQRG